MKTEFHERPTSQEDLDGTRGKYQQIWQRMMAMKPGTTLVIETTPGESYRVRQSISVRMSRDRSKQLNQSLGYMTRKIDDRSFMVIRVANKADRIRTEDNA